MLFCTETNASQEAYTNYFLAVDRALRISCHMFGHLEHRPVDIISFQEIHIIIN